MALTPKEVEHIAMLAHLQLDEQELAKYLPQLEGILEYASRLRKVDTSKISPTTTVLPLRSIVREDIIGESLPVDDALANAAMRERNMFRIPPVFE
jgi:aspartyl-tRNA(Asn)/glutamyl-tRNA(Gln) amidotransferase subunit C